MSDRQRHGFVLLLVVGLMAASVFVLLTQKTVLGLDLKGGIELVYQGEPSPQTPHVTQDALNRAVDIMRSRVDQLGVSEPSIQTTGNNLITVGLPDVHDVARAENEVGQTAQLHFYDWEANVLTPNGKTVEEQLITQDPTAVTISQGAGGGPGVPGAGGVPLYEATKLAAKQPPQPLSKTQSRKGPAYYLFGAPGSAACEAAAKANGTTPVQGQHCLLAGPDSSLPDVYQSLPAGVTKAETELVTVPQGTVVLQAANPSASDQVKPGSPNAEYFVLKDNVALSGTDITNPQPSTDQSGSPDVTFGFNGTGQSAFQKVTGQIAHRGANVSLGGNTFNQHFAVALDNQLVTVPQIDFKQYPDGIVGGGGADITGGFTSQTASDLATQLRLGALPINLKRISEEQVSATLGQQALHQGLVAGAIGLLVVALFLIAYYRILGLIAVAGLAVYGLYFYALIKLIPITLTLAGIAGLILTIGVAADANIVIFERVKEEIRAGRSIRAGIATGYKKGLTAIIDANVVTIMTAFILFVLATSDVQGFAFTLGIGVIVSLFTAVLATQAILMTMSDSRTIARPSALGAGGKHHVWRYDFMGASKYFFSLSGVILLIGALAIGGRGLNLGIDFTSGARIDVALNHPATASSIRSVVSGEGVSDPVVQEVGGKGTPVPDHLQAPQEHQQRPTGAQRQVRRQGLLLRHGGPDVRAHGGPQRRHRHHRLAAGHLGLRGAALRLEVRGAGADRADARPVDHQRRLCVDRKAGDGRHGRGPAHHPGLLPLRHDHRVRPCAGEHPADAQSCLLADRQPVHVRGADPVAGDHVVHAAADPGPAAVRRLHAPGLRLRAAHRRGLGRLFVDLHRLARAHPLEGARASLSPPPRAHRDRVRHGPRVRHLGGRRGA